MPLPRPDFPRSAIYWLTWICSTPLTYNPVRVMTTELCVVSGGGDEPAGGGIWLLTCHRLPGHATGQDHPRADWEHQVSVHSVKVKRFIQLYQMLYGSTTRWLFWKIGGFGPHLFGPGQVKPMKIKTCRFLARHSALLGYGKRLIGSVSG